MSKSPLSSHKLPIPAPNPPIVGSLVELDGIVMTRLWLVTVAVGPFPCWKVFHIEGSNALVAKFCVRAGVTATELEGKVTIATRGITSVRKTTVEIRGVGLIFISYVAIFLC